MFIGNQREQLQREPAQYPSRHIKSRLISGDRCHAVDFEGVWDNCCDTVYHTLSNTINAKAKMPERSLDCYVRIWTPAHIHLCNIGTHTYTRCVSAKTLSLTLNTATYICEPCEMLPSRSVRLLPAPSPFTVELCRATLAPAVLLDS